MVEVFVSGAAKGETQFRFTITPLVMCSAIDSLALDKAVDVGNLAARWGRPFRMKKNGPERLLASGDGRFHVLITMLQPLCTKLFLCYANRHYCHGWKKNEFHLLILGSL